MAAICPLKGFWLILFIIGVFITVATVLLNVMFILASMLITKVRSLHTKLLLLLAVADLMLGLIAWPTTVINIYGYQIGNNIKGARSAHFITAYCLTFLTACCIWVIGFEQYMAIAYPYKHQRIMNAKVTIVPVIVINVVIFATVISLYMETYDEKIDDPYDYFLRAIAVLMFVMILSLIFFFYLKIWRISIKVQRQIQSQNRAEGSRIARKAKAAKTSFLIVIIFFFCYAPRIALEAYKLIRGDSSDPMIHCVSSVFGTLVLAKSMCNPMVYYCRLTKFRESTKRLLQKCLCIKNEIQISDESTTTSELRVRTESNIH